MATATTKIRSPRTKEAEQTVVEKPRAKTKSEQQKSMGSRIRIALRDKDITYTAAAKHLGYTSHASVHNWIEGRAEPPREAIAKLAKLVGRSALWLEQGIEGPVEVAPSAEKMGYELVPEVAFPTANPKDRHEECKWGLPLTFLKEVQIVDTKLAMIYRVQNEAGKYEFNDRLIVDGGATRPGPGDFLYWHGTAPAIGNLSVPIATGRKPSVKVKPLGAEEAQEVDTDKLQVLGRIRGTWRQA